MTKRSNNSFRGDKLGDDVCLVAKISNRNMLWFKLNSGNFPMTQCDSRANSRMGICAIVTCFFLFEAIAIIHLRNWKSKPIFQFLTPSPLRFAFPSRSKLISGRKTFFLALKIAAFSIIGENLIYAAEPQRNNNFSLLPLPVIKSYERLTLIRAQQKNRKLLSN